MQEPYSAGQSAGSGRRATPEGWRPPLSETWCDDATVWATIKIIWELAVTVPEHAALDEMLDTR